MNTRRKYQYKTYQLKLSPKQKTILELCLGQETNLTGLYIEPLIEAGLITTRFHDGKLWGKTTAEGIIRLRHDK